MTKDSDIEAAAEAPGVMNATKQIPQSAASTRVKNRRNQYLNLNPQYFSSALEFAGETLEPRQINHLTYIRSLAL